MFQHFSGIQIAKNAGRVDLTGPHKIEKTSQLREYNSEALQLTVHLAQAQWQINQIPTCLN
jgi:hypothetical protein